MDRETNTRLRELDRRLQEVYAEAYKTALEREKRAIEKLTAFDPANYPNHTPSQIEAQRIAYAREVERATGVAQNIANEIANSGRTAAQIINNARLDVFDSSYNFAFGNIDRQRGFIGSWALYNREQLRVLMDGDAFSRLGAREVYDHNLRRYIRERALGRLGDDIKLRRMLQNELMQSVLLGESMSRIATRIKSITEMSRRQAVTVARTEMMRVANKGRMLGYRQAREDYSINMDKKWVATNDNRTRDTHAAQHNEIVAFDEPFSNGLMYPHDDDAPPEEVINCRCTVVAVLKKSNNLTNGRGNGNVGDTDGYTVIDDVRPIDFNDDIAVQREINVFMEKHKDDLIEHAVVISPYGYIYELTGTAGNVNVELLGADILRNSIGAHNHVIMKGFDRGDSFSIDDLLITAKYKTGKEYLISGNRKDAFEYIGNFSENELRTKYNDAMLKAFDNADKNVYNRDWVKANTFRELSKSIEGLLFYENI